MTARVRAIRQDFDWSSLRYPGERVVLGEIRQDESLSRRLTELSTKRPTATAGGVRIDKTIGSGLARLTEIARLTLQLTTRLELEVVRSTSPDVAIESSTDQRSKLIRISSCLIEGASARQFLFDVGRRLGQSMLDPVSLAADPSREFVEGTRPALLARGLWRFQEMTADRFGLLCCQDAEVAIGRLIQQTCGLGARTLDVDLAEWLEGRPSEEEAMLSPIEDDFLRLRCAALLKFAQSQRYDGAFSATFLELDSAGLPRGSETLDEKDLARPIPPAIPVSPTTPITAVPNESGPALSARPMPEVTYRMVGGDPSVVEAVFSDAGFSASPAPVPTMADASLESEVRRNVGAHAAFWLLSQTEEVTPRQRALLADLYGEEVFDEVRPRFEQYGEQLFPDYCHSRQRDILRLDAGARFDLLKELVRLAMTDHRDPLIYQTVFQELAGLFSLTREDLAMALADFVDPEFAHYGFGPGEAVEVRLDGQWVVGTVESVDHTSGEVRVRFSSTGKALRLHPLADVIRPRSVRQAS